MVVEGPDFDHNAATLLHEVAHYVTHTRSQSINHSLIFYLVFWDLIFASSLPLEKIVLAEVAYKPTAWPALLATGYSPSPLLVEMALQAAAGRILRNAEKTVDKLSRALHASPTPSDTSPPYLAYQKALQRWWRLDRAFTLAYPSPSTA